MSHALIAEYNTIVTEVQLTALRVLKRLLERETDPKELARLTAISFRARPIADPSTPRPSPPARPKAHQAPAQEPPALPQHEPQAHIATPPLAHPLQRMADPAPQERESPPPAPSPLTLMQAAASASPVHGPAAMLARFKPR